MKANTQANSESATRAESVLAHLKPKRAAALLDLQESTLERWRVMGKGPRYRKLNGAVRYSLNDLHDWVQRCQSGGDPAMRSR